MPPDNTQHHREIIGRVFSYLFRGFGEGALEMPFCAYLLYDRIKWASAPEDHTEEEVSTIIQGIERVNARWPGTFIPVSPPRPRPEDRNQVIWIMNSLAFWPERRGDPSDDDLIAVALGEA